MCFHSLAEYIDLDELSPYLRALGFISFTILVLAVSVFVVKTAKRSEERPEKTLPAQTEETKSEETSE